MKFRKKMSKGHSRRMFSATAGMNHVHPKNAYLVAPMRGGIRL